MIFNNGAFLGFVAIGGQRTVLGVSNSFIFSFSFFVSLYQLNIFALEVVMDEEDRKQLLEAGKASVSSVCRISYGRI